VFIRDLEQIRSGREAGALTELRTGFAQAARGVLLIEKLLYVMDTVLQLFVNCPERDRAHAIPAAHAEGT
jgi:hypothetical protein